MHHLDEKDVVQDGDHQEVDKESKPIFENVEHLESLIEKCSRAPNVAIRHESALQLLQELTFENEEDNEIDADDEEDDGEYSCNNITTTLIQISRLFYFGFFSKTNHQMII